MALMVLATVVGSASKGSMDGLAVQISSASEGATKDVDVVLEPAIVPGGMATARYMLTTGDVVQLHSGCNEWASGGTGFVVRRNWSDMSLRVVTFDAGPVAEMDGRLLVASRHQFGSDGTDEPHTPPAGALSSCYDLTGSLLAHRVLAVDLATGTVRHAPWDTFAPATGGKGRYVVLARMQPGHDAICQDRSAGSYLLWDASDGTVVELGPTDEPPSYRVVDDEVFLRVKQEDEWVYLAVDGTQGAIRTVTAHDSWNAPASDGIPWLQGPGLHGDEPASWTTDDGRRILTVPAGSAASPVAPSTGACGVPGPAWTHGLLFTDDGAYHWPADLALST